MQIDSNLIARLGEMTCIELSPGEMEALAADLAQVAAGMERMGEVGFDADGAEEGAAGDGGIANVLRDDEPRPSLPRELALASAPAQDGGAFVVPAAFAAPAPAVSG